MLNKSLDSKLTIEDLEKSPKKLGRFIGFNCEQMVFLYCSSHASSSRLFDTICLLSKKLRIRPTIERYIPLSGEFPIMIILSKLDFDTFFNIPEYNVVAFSDQEKNLLFKELLSNNSLFGNEHSLRSILFRISAATIPAIEVEAEISKEESEPVVIRQETKRRRVKQLTDHSPKLFSPKLSPRSIGHDSTLVKSQLIGTPNDDVPPEVESKDKVYVDSHMLSQYLGVFWKTFEYGVVSSVRHETAETEEESSGHLKNS